LASFSHPAAHQAAAGSSHRSVYYLAVTAIAATLVAACSSGTTSSGVSSGSSSQASGSVINVGVVAPFPGVAAEFGILISAPCRAAVSAVNKAGGVLGHQLACREIDDYGDPADAVPSLEKAFATTSNIDEAIGFESNTAATTIPLVEKQDIPFFTAAGLVSYDTQGDPYFYRMSPSDDQNGAAYSVAASNLGYHRVAVIYANDIGASGNIPGTAKAISNLHMTMTENLVIPGDETSYASTVERVIASKPQALIFYADPQTSATFLANYSQLTGGKLPPMITASSNVAPDFFSALKKVVGATYLTKDIYFVGQAVQSTLPAFSTFAAAMKATGAPPATLGSGVISALYDGINLMSLAMIEANSTSGPVYNKDIVTLTQPQPGAVVVHSFAAGAAALKAGHKIQYVGTGGEIQFNASHNFVGSWGVEQLTATGSPVQLSSIPGTTVLSNA
jgi:branched-chain amino acid transport system substrate-binding protein